MAALALSAAVASGANFVVSATTDLATDPSLRRAINDANANPGPDVIVFQFPSALYPVTLALSSPLPPITEGVVIDGTDGGPCAAGYQPRIQLDGTGLGPTANGLQIQTPQAVSIKGLAIFRFESVGILLSNNLDSVITGNYLGLDVPGLIPGPGNGVGVMLIDCDRVLVGGSDACERNVISGNQRGGVEIYNGDRNQILGNFIGVRPGGTGSMPNRDGISIFGSTHTQVGSVAAGQGNVIAFNQQDGIVMNGALGLPQENLIEGNLIGVGPGGWPPQPNGANGIYFLGGPTRNFARWNTIRFNVSAGVRVLEGTDNTIVENTISDNGSLGIDLTPAFSPNPNDPMDTDAGPNRQQNYPEMYMCVAFPPESGPSGTRIRAMLNSEPLTTFEIHYYWSPSCDGSGFGEGKFFIGRTNVTTDAFGNYGPFVAMFPVSIPVGSVITMTATHPGGSTSEFSPCSCPVIFASQGGLSHDGLPHAPLGGATLIPQADGTLNVGGLDAGGSNGVTIALGRAQGWQGEFKSFELQVGDSLETRGIETVGDRTVARAIGTILYGTNAICPHGRFDQALAPAGLRLELRDGQDRLVDTFHLPNDSTFDLPLCPGSQPIVVCSNAFVRLHTGEDAFWWRFCREICVVPQSPSPKAYPPVQTLCLVAEAPITRIDVGTNVTSSVEVVPKIAPGNQPAGGKVLSLGGEWLQQFGNFHASVNGAMLAGWRRSGGTSDPVSLTVTMPMAVGELPQEGGVSIPLDQARYICVGLGLELPASSGPVLAPAEISVLRQPFFRLIIGTNHVLPPSPDAAFIQQTDFGWDIASSFGTSDTQSNRFEFYLFGTLVGSLELPTGIVARASSQPILAAHSTSPSPVGAPGFAFRWADAVSIIIVARPGGPAGWEPAAAEFFANELRIIPLNPAHPLRYFTRLDIVGAGFPSMEIVGEDTRPARPAPPTIVAGPGGIQILCPTEPGRQYQLEFTRSLGNPAWEVFERFLGDGSVRQFQLPAVQDQERYFRLAGF